MKAPDRTGTLRSAHGTLLTHETLSPYNQDFDPTLRPGMASAPCLA